MPDGQTYGTMCGNLLCPFEGSMSCGKWEDTLGVFVKAAVTLVDNRQGSLCWARNNGVLLLGGTYTPATSKVFNIWKIGNIFPNKISFLFCNSKFLNLINSNLPSDN